MLSQPTERFTGRVESYRRHRPRYPAAIVDLLASECNLTADKRIADIAAGTGILSEIFLERDYSVVAVEPNDEMRAACDELVERFPQLRCVAGTAEATGLPADSFDCVTVGQALHWFDLERTRVEFLRILHRNGWCAVVYNERRLGGDAFHEGYENILREFGIDYTQVQRQHLSADKIEQFFAPSQVRRKVFPNGQELTLDALVGRILSSSYMPKPEHPRYVAMRVAVEKLFQEHQKDGCVHLDYDCAVSYGLIP